MRPTVQLQNHAYQSVKLSPEVRTFRESNEDENLLHDDNTLSPQHINNEETVNTFSSHKFQTKREYLKKGSSINKQIVVNLLKIKLSRERE